MEVRLIGHSCVWFADKAGRRLVTDPCRPGALGGRVWTAPPPPADIVTVSHYHEDHGWLGAVEGAPEILDQTGSALGIDVTFFTTAHDHDGGCISGLNHMYRFMMDGYAVLHPGDIGVLPDAEQCEAIGPVDVLLLPVGGNYTVSPAEALEFAKRLSPRWVIPMHYRTPDVDLPMAPLSVFQSYWDGDIHVPESNRWTPDMPSGLWCLNPPPARSKR